MPRLIDDIRAAGGSQMPNFISGHLVPQWSAYAQAVHGIVRDPQLPVLLIDNVAEYYYKDDQEFWDLTKDFPNIAPPFEACWTEFRLPPIIQSKEKGVTDMTSLLGVGGRAGALVVALKTEDCTGEDIPANARWILWCDMFIDYNDGRRYADGPHGSIFIAVDAQGAIIGHPWIQTYCGKEFTPLMQSLITWLHPTLLAFCFLHCKNVKVQEERVDKPLAKKYHAKTGQWPTRYKTLIIEPLKQILRTQGRSGEVGIKKAIHICRGHFASYGMDGHGLLFGKYTGRFWIPATVRGTKSGGEKAPPREIEVKV